MDATSGDTKQESQPKPKNEPSLAWIALRDFILLTFALSGGLALLDLYVHGQSIRKYLLEAALVSALIVLMGYGRERTQRNLRSKTYLHPGN